MPESPNLLNPGDRVADRYEVVRPLATGGMGEVFVASHADLGTEVAIKVLSRGKEDPDQVARFLREARSAARLKSEHIARVFDFGVLPSGHPFMVLELLQGVDIDGVLELGLVPARLAVDYVLQACEGLAVAHAAGIVHRDIKPSNLFITSHADGSPLVKILDFGIAKDTSDVKKTTGGMGSPYYMSPEQVRAAANVDGRTDVWALGVTLFEMISGERPFEGVIASQVCISIVNDPPVRLDSLVPKLDPELVAVIHRCLEKDRDKRPANVGELAALLIPFASAEGVSHAQRAIRVAGGRLSMASAPESDRPPPPSVRSNPQPTVAETLPAITSSAPPAPSSRRAIWIAAGAAVAVAIGVAATAFFLRPSSTVPTVASGPSVAPTTSSLVSPPTASAAPAESASSPNVVASQTATAGHGSAVATVGAKPTGAGHPAPSAVHSAGSAHTADGTEDRN